VPQKFQVLPTLAPGHRSRPKADQPSARFTVTLMVILGLISVLLAGWPPPSTADESEAAERVGQFIPCQSGHRLLGNLRNHCYRR
jgi:hypothetical protein